ncbi:hypothetical protein BD309DRAFT_968665 [Dichomitus squalens]|nr:hypothetical protein BD309DRAFT_968665 [Dichomitus squalens]
MPHDVLADMAALQFHLVYLSVRLFAFLPRINRSGSLPFRSPYAAQLRLLLPLQVLSTFLAILRATYLRV